VTKEDVRDLFRIADLKGLEQLIEILPSKVGSPLSINSIREDLGYHHGTITTWIEILSRLYLIFTIRPWHRNIVRSIKKEKKLFFFDWSFLEDSGSRFENLLAVALLRMAARFTEMGLGAFELMYARDLIEKIRGAASAEFIELRLPGGDDRFGRQPIRDRSDHRA